jgi:phosphoglycolate phosphatase
MSTAMRPLILLFDIDGTLISTDGAGRRAIERAFAHQHGRADACAGVSFGGMTDQAIFRAGLTAIGAPVEPAAVDALLAAYLSALRDEMTRAACRIHAGIERALDATQGRARCAVGLGTGNIREGARAKLGKVGIYERFAFGGFGCDHEDRGELLRIGAERGAAALGVPRDACRVVVIGDTPKDVAAARVIGATSVAVATGSFSPAELTASGATHVFRDLTDPAAIPTLLGA